MTACNATASFLDGACAQLEPYFRLLVEILGALLAVLALSFGGVGYERVQNWRMAAEKLNLHRENNNIKQRDVELRLEASMNPSSGRASEDSEAKKKNE